MCVGVGVGVFWGGGGGSMVTQSGWKNCPHSWGGWTLGVIFS